MRPLRAKAHTFCMIAKHLDAYVTSDRRAVSVALAFCDRWQPRWPRVGWQSLPNLAATSLAWWPPTATVFATDWLPPAVAAVPRQPQPQAVAATAPQQQRQLGEANGPLEATSAACVVAGNVCRGNTDRHHVQWRRRLQPLQPSTNLVATMVCRLLPGHAHPQPCRIVNELANRQGHTQRHNAD